MNEVIKAMKERRSIRKFKAEMPPKADLEQIVEAGLYAANGRGRQAVITIAVTDKELRDKLAEELIYITHHPKESSFHLIGHLYLFLDYLIQSAHSTQLVSSSKMSDYYIKEAINYIEQNFQNNVSIEDVAAVCGINRSYLGKIFKKSTGQSPQEFLMNYRMVKAAELLKLTSLSIADIGSAVGYENQLHFSRAFKNIYGVSPREWRNQHK